MARNQRPHPSITKSEPGSLESTPLLQDRSYLAYLRPTPKPFLHFASGHFPPSTRTVPHSHPCIAIHGCLQGPVVLCTTEDEMLLDAGIFYLIPPGVQHGWRNDGRQTATTFSFLLDASHPGRWPSNTGVENCCRELETSVGELHRFTTSGDKELHYSFWLAADYLTAEQPRQPSILAGILLTFLGQIHERLLGKSEPSTADPGPAQEIRRLLLSRVRDRLTIRQIAREVCMSPTRTKETFREAFGCGIMTYFNQLKIWQAKRYLLDLSLTIEQISQQLGFSSPSYFSRAFLKHTGESPTGYRQTNKQSK
jgi:AraC-like DNA-binding protein